MGLGNKMKRILFSLVPATAMAVALSCSAATAADLPVRKAPVAYAASAFSWTGFYAGVNAGYAWNGGGDFDHVDVNSTVIPGFSRAADGFDFLGNSNKGSFTGGGQIGYNYQMGNIVLGLEADINYAGVKKNYAAGGDRAGVYHDVLSAESKVQWFGTVRPRLGFLPTDRLMMFVTGGLAYGQVKTLAGNQRLRLRNGCAARRNQRIEDGNAHRLHGRRRYRICAGRQCEPQGRIFLCRSRQHHAPFL